MTEALAFLEQAKRHLLASEPDIALERIKEFEQSLLAGQVRKDSVNACSQALLAVRTLADAAREGVAAAQRQLAEISALSRKLDTYDREGRRIGSPVAQPREKRF